MKNRKKTSFTLDIETMQGLSHLAKINKRSMANMIDILVSEKLKERENEFFNHMNKKEKNTRK
jgi:hypothetical protein